MADNKKADWWA